VSDDASNEGKSRTTRLLDQDLPPDVSRSLSLMERLHFTLALRMNREPAKGLWSEIQSLVGATFIELVTGKLLEVHGFENVEEAYRRGAVLLVANHRSYF
jgi:hypothetical protein